VKLWLDAQISPTTASWLREAFGVDAMAVRELGLIAAKDRDIFDAARAAGAVVMTKDSDFVTLQERLGLPPQIIWLTCGNTSNARLRALLMECWPKAQSLLDAGERLVEIGDRPQRPA
jgi:predicted nuclease of predicted toxin-antitoxin system